MSSCTARTSAAIVRWSSNSGDSLQDVADGLREAPGKSQGPSKRAKNRGTDDVSTAGSLQTVQLVEASLEDLEVALERVVMQRAPPVRLEQVWMLSKHAKVKAKREAKRGQEEGQDEVATF